MDDYSVVFTSSARKELEKLTAPLVKRIFNSIALFTALMTTSRL